MTRLCFFVTLFLFIFVVPTFASAPASPIAESTPSPKLVIELSLSELPKIYLTPASPFYFLKTLWEDMRWHIERSPEGKADLALELAKERLSEALKVSGGKNFSLVERLFRESRVLLNRAGSEMGRITKDEGQKEKIRRESLRQLALGRAVLSKIKESLGGEEAQRADNLSAWQDSWMAKLEEGLGPRSEFLEAIVSAVPLEATPEATRLAAGEPRRERGGGISVWEFLFNFLFGPRRALLSPLAAPGGD